MRSVSLQIPLGASLPRLYILSLQRWREKLRERERENVKSRAVTATKSLGNEIYSVSRSVMFKLFATPGTVAHQAPLSMEVSRQE